MSGTNFTCLFCGGPVPEDRVCDGCGHTVCEACDHNPDPQVKHDPYEHRRIPGGK